jgi:hypothetical protein
VIRREARLLPEAGPETARIGQAIPDLGQEQAAPLAFGQDHAVAARAPGSAQAILGIEVDRPRGR